MSDEAPKSYRFETDAERVQRAAAEEYIRTHPGDGVLQEAVRLNRILIDTLLEQLGPERLRLPEALRGQVVGWDETLGVLVVRGS